MMSEFEPEYKNLAKNYNSKAAKNFLNEVFDKSDAVGFCTSEDIKILGSLLKDPRFLNSKNYSMLVHEISNRNYLFSRGALENYVNIIIGVYSKMQNSNSRMESCILILKTFNLEKSVEIMIDLLRNQFISSLPVSELIWELNGALSHEGIDSKLKNKIRSEFKVVGV